MRLFDYGLEQNFYLIIQENYHVCLHQVYRKIAICHPFENVSFLIFRASSSEDYLDFYSKHLYSISHVHIVMHDCFTEASSTRRFQCIQLLGSLQEAVLLLCILVQSCTTSASDYRCCSWSGHCTCTMLQ